MKLALLVLLAAALAGCASDRSRLPMTYEGKPRVPINKPAAVAAPLVDAPIKKGE